MMAVLLAEVERLWLLRIITNVAATVTTTAAAVAAAIIVHVIEVKGPRRPHTVAIEVEHCCSRRRISPFLRNAPTFIEKPAAAAAVMVMMIETVNIIITIVCYVVARRHHNRPL